MTPEPALGSQLAGALVLFALIFGAAVLIALWPEPKPRPPKHTDCAACGTKEAT